MAAVQKRVVAAFDFDGTLTSRDTLFDFLGHAYGFPSLASGVLASAGDFAMAATRLTSRSQAKERFLGRFIQGETRDRFLQRCQDYALRVPSLLRPMAEKKLAWHLAEGHSAYIVSASPEDWILPWATQAGFAGVLATRLEVYQGRMTGRFSGVNCHGPEKVVRLQEALGPRDGYVLFAYGDSRGDRELLAYADEGHYRVF
uniref:SpaR n=1 Tax=Spirochaeta aurantia TaxID=147 RepID=Q0PHY8_SPIAU|nr:SpaR [Spirochaeta aurantia]